MKKKTVLRIIIFALIVIWMLVIFKLSNQDGEQSSNLSRTIAMQIVKEEEQVDRIEPYIRKMAHLSEYIVGGILFLALFLTYDFSERKRMFFSLLIGIEYATLDEVHQLFINGREGQMIDVCIDSIGVSIGICSMMILYKIIINILQKRKDGVLDKQKIHEYN